MQGGRPPFLFIKLTPPVLRPGEDGELLIGADTRMPVPSGAKLQCGVQIANGRWVETDLLAQRAPLSVSAVRFSNDMRTIVVYVENRDDAMMTAQLYKVDGAVLREDHTEGETRVPPGDKRCLWFRSSRPFEFGAYVRLHVVAHCRNTRYDARRIVRAAHLFPLCFQNGTTDPELGLDVAPFLSRKHIPAIRRPSHLCLVCPAHGQRRPERACHEFLSSRHELFARAPRVLSAMWVCRSGSPSSYFRFNALADLTISNTCLWLPASNLHMPKDALHPFFARACLAVAGADLNWVLACVPVGHDTPIFRDGYPSPAELRFMAYSAIAAGCKGILYRHRGRALADPLVRLSFRRLNEELRSLRPLLAVCEPVSWAETTSPAYGVQALLCRDEAIIVVILDRRTLGRQSGHHVRTPAFDRTTTQVPVTLRLPCVRSPRSVHLPVASIHPVTWSCRDTKVCFQADMSRSAEAYVVTFADHGQQ